MPFGHQAGQPATNEGRTFPPETLTPAEVEAIIGACSPRSRTGIRNRALTMLLYRSGLRISEALALKKSDIDFKSHSCRVLHGKGNKATTRAFHPTADDVLYRWIEAREGLGVRNAPLFCTLDGEPLSDRYVRNLLHRLADKAGVDKRVHPHGLRHTYAAELERSGLSITKISMLLGHSSTAVTDRYLKHLTNDEAIAALAAVDLPPLNV